MNKYCAALWSAAAMAVIATAAHASMVIADNIVGLTQRADVVIRVDCTASEQTFAGKELPGVAKVAGMQPRVKAMKRYTFTVKDVLVNKTAQEWRAGDTFDFGQFQGFTMSSGQIVRPSVRLPDFRAGSEYMLFLKKRGDRYFTVGVNQGVFDVADGSVSNPYMKATMFKGIDVDAPGVSKALGVGKISISAPPPKVDVDAFTAMVKTIASGTAKGVAR